MTTKPVPTMDTEGWVETIAGRCDRLMTYFVTTMKSQSLIYGSHIKSWPWILQNCQKDFDKLVNYTQAALEEYFNAYFDSCSVNVEMKEAPTDPAAKLTIQISITVVENGEVYDIANQLVAVNGKFKELMKLINEG